MNRAPLILLATLCLAGCDRKAYVPPPKAKLIAQATIDGHELAVYQVSEFVRCGVFYANGGQQLSCWSSI